MSALYCKYFKLPYPENLILTIFDESTDTPKDIEEVIDYVLETLNDREKRFILVRFKEHKTYKAVGEEHGVSAERSRQIIMKALRKLMHPSRSDIIRYGVFEATARREERAKKAKDEARAEALAKHQGDGISLSELELSLRSFNALTRKGFNTLIEVDAFIQEKGTDWNKHIRHMGVKSKREIENILSLYGFI